MHVVSRVRSDLRARIAHPSVSCGVDRGRPRRPAAGLRGAGLQRAAPRRRRRPGPGGRRDREAGCSTSATRRRTGRRSPRSTATPPSAAWGCTWSPSCRRPTAGRSGPGRKHVWARLPSGRAEGTERHRSQLPEPRGPRTIPPGLSGPRHAGLDGCPEPGGVLPDGGHRRRARPPRPPRRPRPAADGRPPAPAPRPQPAPAAGRPPRAGGRPAARRPAAASAGAGPRPAAGGRRRRAGRSPSDDEGQQPQRAGQGDERPAATAARRPPAATAARGRGPRSVPATARSSRSASSPSDTSTVRRRSSRQACGRPVAHDVPGPPDRRGDPGELHRPGRGQRGAGPLVAQVQPLQRVRPQLPRPADQRPAGAGDAVAQRRPLDGRRHGGHTGGVGQGVAQVLDQLRRAPGGRARRRRRPGSARRSPAAAPRTSAVSRSVAARRAATRRASSPRSSATPVPVRAETASSGVARQPLAVQQRPQVGQALLRGGGVEPVDLVEDDEQHPGVPGQRRRGSGRAPRRRRTSPGRAPRPGRRRARPAGRPPAGARAGRCRGRAGRAGPARPAPARARAGAGGAPPASRAAGRRPSSPQTVACATPVVGRRTPGLLTSPPDSALNSVDFPLPVAPASATTVASPSAARAPALASSARARPTSGTSSRPSATSTASRSAASRSASGSSRRLMPRPGGPRRARRTAARSAVGRAAAPARRASTRSVEAVLLVAQQRVGPGLQVLPGAGGQRADGGVAEHRLQHPLADRGRAAGHGDLPAGQPAGLGEDGDHDHRAGPVDAPGEDPGPGPLVRALVRGPGRGRRPASRAPAPRPPRGSPATPAPARAPRRPAAPPRPAASARPSPCARRRGRPRPAAAARRCSPARPAGRRPGVGRPVTALTTRSRSRLTWPCRARIHSPVPTNSCQRASTSPRSSVPLRTPSSMPARAAS